jgi:methyl-accepting chemotaxis protein
MTWLNDLAIRGKLLLGFVLMAVTTGVVGWTGYSAANELHKNGSEMYSNYLLSVRDLGEARAQFFLARAEVRDILLTKDPAKRREHSAAVDAAAKKVDQHFGSYLDTPLSKEEQAIIPGFKTALAEYRRHRARAIEFASKGQDSQAVQAMADGHQTGTDALNMLDQLSEINVRLAGEQQKSNELTAASSERKILIVVFIALVVAVGLGWLLARVIADPLRAAAKHLEQVADGDLSRDAPAEFQARGDEIGLLARGKQKMILSLRTMVKEISGGIEVLASSSTELLASSSQMTSGSRRASDKAHTVAAAAEEMSSNVTSVAAGMEQTTTSLAHVATATEQMTATIDEIAGNSEKARRITGEATRQAAEITAQINQLGQAARDIDKVTETITEISSQTNLLALNATIEAARAGSAGKGFAVVANEIKTLAQQTAAATEDIRGRIAGVQSATAGSITEIEKVSRVIDEVNGIVASIAAAIEEQAAATKSIAANIGEASAGVDDANKRVAESSQVSREIARDIVDVDRSAGEMANGSDHVRSSAAELTKVAEALSITAARFRA